MGEASKRRGPRLLTGLAMAVCLALTTTDVAYAQKARDTLRLAYSEPIDNLSTYYTSHPGTEIFTGAVFESLVDFDPNAHKIVPVLAKSWARVGSTTLEFDLRDDVAFHNGSKFDADDVVDIINWVIAPETKLRFKDNWAFIDRIEKLGPYKIRIHSKTPFAADIAMLSTARILDSDLLNSMVDKSVYGRENMIGSGPYKVIQRDVNKGVIIEKVDSPRFKPFNAKYINRVHGLAVPDKLTQIARLLVGELDVVGDLERDQIADLKRNPNLEVTTRAGLGFYYLQLDAANRSGRRELSDVRVRRAIVQAIDRQALISNLLAGAEIAEALPAFCLKVQIGCAWTKPVPPYDPEAAKRLLAEAGYPNGFELILDSILEVPHTLAQAIEGQLRKVGIKAIHKPLAIPVYRNLQGEGKLEAHLSPWTNDPDVARDINRFFTPGALDFFQDETINKLRLEGLETMDPQKREAVYSRLYDRVNEMAYMLPISSQPILFVHGKDVKIETDISVGLWGAYPMDFSWR